MEHPLYKPHVYEMLLQYNLIVHVTDGTTFFFYLLTNRI